MLSNIYNKIINDESSFLQKYDVAFNNSINRIIIRRKEPTQEQLYQYIPDLSIDNKKVKHQFVIEYNDYCFYRQIYIRIADEKLRIADKKLFTYYFLPEYYSKTMIFGEPDITEMLNYIIKTEYYLLFEKNILENISHIHPVFEFTTYFSPRI